MNRYDHINLEQWYWPYWLKINDPETIQKVLRWNQSYNSDVSHFNVSVCLQDQNVLQTLSHSLNFQRHLLAAVILFWNIQHFFLWSEHTCRYFHLTVLSGRVYLPLWRSGALLPAWPINRIHCATLLFTHILSNAPIHIQQNVFTFLLSSCSA